MFLKLYLGLVELLQKVPFSPQFPGVSKRLARQSPAIAIHTMVMTVILYGIYYNFIGGSDRTSARYVAILPFTAIFATDWYLVLKLPRQWISTPMQLVSLFLYSALLFLSFNGWRFPSLG